MNMQHAKGISSTFFIIVMIIVILSTLLFYYLFKVRISIFIREKSSWSEDLNLPGYLLLSKCRNITFADLISAYYYSAISDSILKECLEELANDTCINITIKDSSVKYVSNCRNFKQYYDFALIFPIGVESYDLMHFEPRDIFRWSLLEFEVGR